MRLHGLVLHMLVLHRLRWHGLQGLAMRRLLQGLALHGLHRLVLHGLVHGLVHGLMLRGLLHRRRPLLATRHEGVDLLLGCCLLLHACLLWYAVPPHSSCRVLGHALWQGCNGLGCLGLELRRKPAEQPRLHSNAHLLPGGGMA